MFKNLFRKLRQNWEKATVWSVCWYQDRSADLQYCLFTLAEFMKKLLVNCFHFPCLALSLSSSNPDGFQHLTIALPTQYSRNDQEGRGGVRWSASWAACEEPSSEWMREVRRSVGEIQQSLLAVSPLFPLATEVDWSYLNPLGLSRCGGIIPSPTLKGYRDFLFLSDIYSIFPVLSCSLSHLNSVDLFLPARCAGHREPGLPPS